MKPVTEIKNPKLRKAAIVALAAVTAAVVIGSVIAKTSVHIAKTVTFARDTWKAEWDHYTPLIKDAWAI